MRAMITKGGLYTWLNVRENKFIEEKFKENKLLEKKRFERKRTTYCTDTSRQRRLR
jgi:hypothetical protein